MKKNSHVVRIPPELYEELKNISHETKLNMQDAGILLARRLKHEKRKTDVWDIFKF